MENSTPENTSAFSRFSEKISEQVWFQELKQKWEDIDPKTRFIAQLCALGGFVLGLTIVIGFSYWKTMGLKSEYLLKAELLSIIQASNDEIRQMSSERTLVGGGTGQDLSTAEAMKGYIGSLAETANLNPETISVDEVKPGKSSDLYEETLSAVTLANVNIKQMTQIAFGIENGSHPIRLRRLEIETRPDQTGFITAKLHLSSYKIK